MSQAREQFLERVRQAVRAGQQAGAGAELPRRDGFGYQGAGADPAAHFRDQLHAAGGQCYFVDRGEAPAKVLEIVRERSARRVLLSRHPLIDALDLAGQLRSAGIEVATADELAGGECRDTLFAADLGISGADYLIAETGTVVLAARPDEPRSFSLLPPVHVVLAERGQLVADLFDLFEGKLPEMPSCLALITGPSKTGDIELKLVTGVHGPGEIHVVLVSD